VREKLDALCESLRHYVAAVVGSVQRKKPETQALSDALTQPLVNWQRSKRKSKGEAKKAEGKKGEEPQGE
jgi:hypothetical protein